MKFLPKLSKWHQQRADKLKRKLSLIQRRQSASSAKQRLKSSDGPTGDGIPQHARLDYLMQIDLHSPPPEFGRMRRPPTPPPPRFLARGTRQNYLYEGTFQEAVGRVFLVAEFFALMPVKGVTSKDPRRMSFSWMNVRTWWCMAFILLTSLEYTLVLRRVFIRPITFNTIEPIIFRLSIVLVCISALKLARKWRHLMMLWGKVESELPPYQTQAEKRRMAHSIHMVTFVAMMLSLAEHLLNVISNIHDTNYCPVYKDPIKNFFYITNLHVFEVFPYSVYMAILAKTENVLQTFIWNYMDVFVMIMSIGLSSKFRQFNDNLFKYKGMPMPELFWMQSRIQYRNLCVLCQKIDDAISVITIISFSNNLYFICVQLLKSLNNMPSVAHALYFYYSLFFLIGRTLAVSLYSSGINDESQKPLRVIRCVPKESWCGEVKRFAEDITTDTVALSGMKFFHLTRKLVLSVAGTIVTYELVLIQFHEESKVGICIDQRAQLS